MLAGFYKPVQEDVLISSINDNELKHSDGPWLTTFVAFIRAASVPQIN